MEKNIKINPKVGMYAPSKPVCNYHDISKFQ